MNSTSSDPPDLKFCIDTSSFIHGWRRDYPPDVFPGVWDSLSQFAGNRILIAPDEVFIELERGGDEIYEWAKAHSEMFLQPDKAVQAEVERIVNTWGSFVPTLSHDGVWADPYVIAFAVVNQGVVVTGEGRVGSNARVPKIPNICDSLGVPCTNLLGLLRSQGLRF